MGIITYYLFYKTIMTWLNHKRENKLYQLKAKQLNGRFSASREERNRLQADRRKVDQIKVKSRLYAGSAFFNLLVIISCKGYSARNLTTVFASTLTCLLVLAANRL